MSGFTPYAVADPLAGQDTASGGTAGTERLSMTEGLMLSAHHFATEQLYHRSRLSRLLTFLHGSGTVAGLDVRQVDVGEDDVTLTQIQVSAGLAVDTLGRLIEHRFKSCIRLGDWMAQTAADVDGQQQLQGGFRAAALGRPDHVAVDVVAAFQAYAHRPEPAFATGNADQIDGVEPTLNVDSCRLVLEVRSAGAGVGDQSDISELVPGSVDIARLQRAKRETLWEAGADAEDRAVHLARLIVPVRTNDAGDLVFEDSFTAADPSIAPDFEGRLYSYSAAELALLAGHRR